MKSFVVTVLLGMSFALVSCDADQPEAIQPNLVNMRFPNTYGISDAEWLTISDDALRSRTNLDRIARTLSSKLNPTATEAYLVGLAYNWGWGLPADPTEAARWYQRGVAASEPRSMNNYGFLLARGSGVAKNERRAIELYRSAAQAGNIFSMANYANRLRDGRGVSTNIEQAFYWFKRANELGNVCAAVDLAAFYASGRAVSRDQSTARQLAESGMECDDSTQRQRAAEFLSSF